MPSALTRTLQQPAAELRELELDRLDRLQVRVWGKAIEGNVGAIDRVPRIMERRARLLGLDHADGIAERVVQLERDKVRVVAVAFGKALDTLDLTDEQREVAARTLIAELKVAPDPDDELTSDPAELEERYYAVTSL